jgi:hypothetical protein
MGTTTEELRKVKMVECFMMGCGSDINEEMVQRKF